MKRRCLTIDELLIRIIIAIIALAFGCLVGYIIRKTIGERAIGSAEQKAKNLILDAEHKSETIKKEITIEAKEEAHRIRSEAEREIRERRSELSKAERRLIQKEEAHDRKIENLERREDNLAKKNRRFRKRLRSLTAISRNR